MISFRGRLGSHNRPAEQYSRCDRVFLHACATNWCLTRCFRTPSTTLESGGMRGSMDSLKAGPSTASQHQQVYRLVLLEVPYTFLSDSRVLEYTGSRAFKLDTRVRWDAGVNGLMPRVLREQALLTRQLPAAQHARCARLCRPSGLRKVWKIDDSQPVFKKPQEHPKSIFYTSKSRDVYF